jgi:hypothetical protein
MKNLILLVSLVVMMSSCVLVGFNTEPSQAEYLKEQQKQNTFVSWEQIQKNAIRDEKDRQKYIKRFPDRSDKYGKRLLKLRAKSNGSDKKKKKDKK